MKQILLNKLHTTQETLNNKEEIIPFAVTFNPMFRRNVNIFNAVTSYLQILQRSDIVKKRITEKTTVQSRRQPKHLKR